MTYGYQNTGGYGYAPMTGGRPQSMGGALPYAMPEIPTSHANTGIEADERRRQILKQMGMDEGELDNFFKARQGFTQAKMDARQALGDTITGTAKEGALSSALSAYGKSAATTAAAGGTAAAAGGAGAMGALAAL
jgi:hypothetical protein